MRSAKRALRIGLFTYSTQARGGVAHAIELGGALHDLGHDVVLYGLDDTGFGFFRAPRCASHAIRVSRVPQRSDLFALVTLRIQAYVDALETCLAGGEARDRPYDIYHAHDGISGNALATLVERGRMRDFVRTVHHADDFASAPLASLQSRSITAASSVFTVSDLWQREVRARFGVDASRVKSGVDAERFRRLAAGERAPVRDEFALTGGPIVLAVGGIEARKNTISILEAFALLRQMHRSAQLVIVGGSSVLDHSAYRAAFDARLEALGLSMRARGSLEHAAVVHLGVLPDDVMPRLIGAADVLAFPSLVEGFGLVVLEALACGVPVVTSAIAPFTEYLRNGEAILVDPLDSASIAAGLHTALSRRAPSADKLAALTLVREYGWAASARGHVREYEEVIDARNALHGTLAR